MAITYVAAGVFQGAQAALTVPLPAGTTTNDLLVIAVESANEAVTTPTEWTLLTTAVGTGTAGAAGAVRLTVFYKFHDGSEASVTIADSGNHQTAQMFAFRGVNKAPANFVIGSGTLAAATSLTIPAVTTTAADSLVFWMIATDRDLASTTNFSAFTNANLTSITEVADEGISTQAGGGLAAYTSFKATAATTGTSAVTQAASAAVAYTTLALTPQVSHALAASVTNVASVVTATVSSLPAAFVGTLRCQASAGKGIGFLDKANFAYTRASSSPENNYTSSIISKGDTFVAGRENNGKINYSTDGGVTWSGDTALPNSPYTDSPVYVGRVASKFIALRRNSAAATTTLAWHTSTDGVTWGNYVTQTGLASSSYGYQLHYANEYAMYFHGTSLVYTNDGVTWTEKTNALGGSSFYGYQTVLYFPEQGMYLFFSSASGGTYYTTTDLASAWTARTTPTSLASMKKYSAAYGNGQLIVSQVSTANYYVSTDGINWTGYAKPSLSGNRSETFVYANQSWVAIPDAAAPFDVSTLYNGIYVSDTTSDLTANSWKQWFGPSYSPLGPTLEQIRFVDVVVVNEDDNTVGIVGSSWDVGFVTNLPTFFRMPPAPSMSAVLDSGVANPMGTATATCSASVVEADLMRLRASIRSEVSAGTLASVGSFGIVDTGTAAVTGANLTFNQFPISTGHGYVVIPEGTYSAGANVGYLYSTNGTTWTSTTFNNSGGRTITLDRSGVMTEEAPYSEIAFFSQTGTTTVDYFYNETGVSGFSRQQANFATASTFVEGVHWLHGVTASVRNGSEILGGSIGGSFNTPTTEPFAGRAALWVRFESNARVVMIPRGGNKAYWATNYLFSWNEVSLGNTVPDKRGYFGPDVNVGFLCQPLTDGASNHQYAVSTDGQTWTVWTMPWQPTGDLWWSGTGWIVLRANGDAIFVWGMGDGEYDVLSTNYLVNGTLQVPPLYPSSLTPAFLGAPPTETTGPGGGTINYKISQATREKGVRLHTPAKKAFVSTLANVSTATGALSTGISMNAAITVVSTVINADLKGLAAALAANIASLSTALSASLTTAVRLNAVVSAQTTITGAALATEIKAQTSVAALSTLTGAISTSIRLNSSTAVVSSLTGDLTTAVRLASSVAALSTSTSALTAQIQLASAVAAASTATSDLTVGGAAAVLEAAVASEATVTGALTTAIRPAASVAALSTVTGALTTAITPVASVAALSTLTGALTTAIRPAASVAALSTTTAALTTAIQSAASIAALSTLTGALTTDIRLAASVAALSTATADLTAGAGIPLDAAVTDVVSTTGALTTGIALVASLTAQTNNVLASLNTGIPLVGVLAAALSTAAGALTTSIRLAASIAAVAENSGALTTEIALTSSVAAISTATGDLTVQGIWQASGAALTTVTGALTTQIALASGIEVLSTATGALTTQVRLASSAVALSAATGALTTQIALASGVAALSSATATMFSAGTPVLSNPTVINRTTTTVTPRVTYSF